MDQTENFEKGFSLFRNTKDLYSYSLPEREITYQFVSPFDFADVSIPSSIVQVQFLILDYDSIILDHLDGRDPLKSFFISVKSHLDKKFKEISLHDEESFKTFNDQIQGALNQVKLNGPVFKVTSVEIVYELPIEIKRGFEQRLQQKANYEAQRDQLDRLGISENVRAILTDPLRREKYLDEIMKMELEGKQEWLKSRMRLIEEYHRKNSHEGMPLDELKMFLNTGDEIYRGNAFDSKPILPKSIGNGEKNKIVRENNVIELGEGDL